NRKILESIEDCFDAISHPSEEARLIELGDGAIIFLNDLDSAVELAVALGERWRQVSEPILDPNYIRQFRMGLTIDRVKMRVVPPWLSRIPRVQAAGPGIALATRLQSQDLGSPGSILIDEFAATKLEPANKARFSETVDISYKDHEKGLVRLPEKGHVFRGENTLV
ncbi:MAG: hypothetical protein AAF491_08320, partial [Verrucomicrobiota bacterium]